MHKSGASKHRLNLDCDRELNTSLSVPTSTNKQYPPFAGVLLHGMTSIANELNPIRKKLGESYCC